MVSDDSSTTKKETSGWVADRNLLKETSGWVADRNLLKSVSFSIIGITLIGIIVITNSYYLVPLSNDEVEPGSDGSGLEAYLGDDSETKSEDLVEETSKSTEITEKQFISPQANQPQPYSPPVNQFSSSSLPLISPNLFSTIQYIINNLTQVQLIDLIGFEISKIHSIDKNKVIQVINNLTEATKAQGGDVMKNLRVLGTTIIQNPSHPIIDKIIAINSTFSFLPTSSILNTSSYLIPSLSMENINTLDKNQLIDAISSRISQLQNFDKNKITQALLDLTQTTASNGGDVMKNLRLIGTTIIENPSAPLISKIINIAQTK
jgi:hypothetical protein